MVILQRGEHVIMISDNGEEMGIPGDLEVMDVPQRLKQKGMLTPAAAALLAIGKVPLILTEIHQPDGQVITL